MFENKNYELWQGDCLELMKSIPNGSIDMILCDLPYGTTQNKWDTVIPMGKLWREYDRIIKKNGMICLTCVMRFAIELLSYIPKEYKYYDLIWDKKSTTGFLNSKRQPLRRHEIILCIYKKQTTYNPIMEVRGKPREKGYYNKKLGNGDGCYGKYENLKSINNEYYPTSILEFSNANRLEKYHSTQKPVSMLEYLIKTYTYPGEVILDNCMGSGSTGVAALNTGRKFIGIELMEQYFEIAAKRITEVEE